MSKLKDLIRGKERNPSLITFAWLACVLIVLVLMVVLFRFETPPPKKIVIATGSRKGAYYAFAQQYAAHFARNNIEVEILETAGSVENLRLLIAGKADIAMAQGGVMESVKDAGNLRSLGSLYYEPMWVFYRGQPMRLLGDLRGKRINIGPDGSGTQAVARKLLEVNGLNQPETIVQTLGSAAAAQALVKNEIDAAFFIASPKAAIIKELIGRDDLNIMNFRRHGAYARNFGFIKQITVVEGLLDLKRDIPRQDTVLLATTATFVAKKDIHPAIVELLLQSAREVHGKQSILHDEGEFPTARYTEFDLLESARQNLTEGPSLLSRYLPFWMVLLVRRLMLMMIPLLTLLIPIGKGLPLVFHWIAKRKIDKKYVRLFIIEDIVNRDKSPELLDEAMAEVRELCIQAEAIKAPTGYRKDVYQLRWHAAHLLERLKERRTKAGGS